MRSHEWSRCTRFYGFHIFHCSCNRPLQYSCCLCHSFLGFVEVCGNSSISLSFHEYIYIGHNLSCLAMNNFALQFTFYRRHLKSDWMFVCMLVLHLNSVCNTYSCVHNWNATNRNTHLWSNIGIWTRPNPWHTHKWEGRKNNTRMLPVSPRFVASWCIIILLSLQDTHC